MKTKEPNQDIDINPPSQSSHRKTDPDCLTLIEEAELLKLHPGATPAEIFKNLDESVRHLARPYSDFATERIQGTKALNYIVSERLYREACDDKGAPIYRNADAYYEAVGLKDRRHASLLLRAERFFSKLPPSFPLPPSTVGAVAPLLFLLSDTEQLPEALEKIQSAGKWTAGTAKEVAAKIKGTPYSRPQRQTELNEEIVTLLEDFKTHDLPKGINTEKLDAAIARLTPKQKRVASSEVQPPLTQLPAAEPIDIKTTPPAPIVPESAPKYPVPPPEAAAESDPPVQQPHVEMPDQTAPIAHVTPPAQFDFFMPARPTHSRPCPSFISNPVNFGGEIRFQFIGQGSATKARKATVCALGFSKVSNSKFWHLKAGAEAASIIEQLLARLAKT